MGHLFVDDRGYGGIIYKRASIGAPRLVALVELFGGRWRGFDRCIDIPLHLWYSLLYYQVCGAWNKESYVNIREEFPYFIYSGNPWNPYDRCSATLRPHHPRSHRTTCFPPRLSFDFFELLLQSFLLLKLSDGSSIYLNLFIRIGEGNLQMVYFYGGCSL